MDKKRKPFKVKRVIELSNNRVLENTSQDANMCMPDFNETRVEIIDLEEMKKRLHDLKMEQQHSINNRNYFQNEIELMEEEILRLIEKIGMLEEEKH